MSDTEEYYLLNIQKNYSDFVKWLKDYITDEKYISEKIYDEINEAMVIFHVNKN